MLRYVVTVCGVWKHLDRLSFKRVAGHISKFSHWLKWRVRKIELTLGLRYKNVKNIPFVHAVTLNNYFKLQSDRSVREALASIGSGTFSEVRSLDVPWWHCPVTWVWNFHICRKYVKYSVATNGAAKRRCFFKVFAKNLMGDMKTPLPKTGRGLNPAYWNTEELTTVALA